MVGSQATLTGSLACSHSGCDDFCDLSRSGGRASHLSLSTSHWQVFWCFSHSALQCVVGKRQPRPLRFGATYIPWVIKSMSSYILSMKILVSYLEMTNVKVAETGKGAWELSCRCYYIYYIFLSHSSLGWCDQERFL